MSERPSGVSEPPSSSVGDFDSDAPEDETALSPLLQASHASSVAFVAPGEGAVGPKPTSVETPIAFSATEGGGAPLEPTALADLEAQAMTSSASTRRLAIVGIAIVAIVLLVALLSYGR